MTKCLSGNFSDHVFQYVGIRPIDRQDEAGSCKHAEFTLWDGYFQQCSHSAAMGCLPGQDIYHTYVYECLYPIQFSEIPGY